MGTAGDHRGTGRGLANGLGWLAGDFQGASSAEERALLLGFGTGFSRPPAAGFDRLSGFNGQRIAVDYSDPGAQRWYEKGRQYYWAKRGQLNFSCASCHVQNAGNKIRGDVLSPGLGHGVGFPVYRTKWSMSGKPWGTMHRRYGGCNKQVRAKPFKAQGDEYKALELYEAVMNTGVPLKVPSQRQ